MVIYIVVKEEQEEDNYEITEMYNSPLPALSKKQVLSPLWPQNSVGVGPQWRPR